MKWSDSIPFRQPLGDVRLLVQTPAQGWTDFLREREQAAYERGRQDGKTALTRQLMQHQGEAGELQNGVLLSLTRAIPQVVRETENALIQLALDAAQKIVAGLPITAEMVAAVGRLRRNHRAAASRRPRVAAVASFARAHRPAGIWSAAFRRLV
jgi:hypothetical protein